MGQLKSTLYARMEEVSFRSGAAVAGGVLTAAGVAITLAVVLGGHSDAVASAPASRAAIPSVVPPVLAPVSSSPSATPPATSRASRTAAPATVAGTYQPPSAARAAATLHAAATAWATPSPRVAWNRAPRGLGVARLAGARRRGRGRGGVACTASPPPLIAGLACLVVLYSRREPGAPRVPELGQCALVPTHRYNKLAGKGRWWC